MTTLADSIHNQNAIAIRDAEFSGDIARSAQQGAKFALMLAMLEQNVLKRPKVVSVAEHSEDTALTSLENTYRPFPLKADNKHWQCADLARKIIHSQPTDDARLWLCMHPDPLSLFNDANRLDASVTANTSYQTQLALKQPLTSADIDVEETQLYDVLQSIHGVAV